MASTSLDSGTVSTRTIAAATMIAAAAKPNRRKAAGRLSICPFSQNVSNASKHATRLALATHAPADQPGPNRSELSAEGERPFKRHLHQACVHSARCCGTLGRTDVRSYPWRGE